MFLCDAHCHSSGISKCCQTDYKGAIDSAKQAEFDAIVLTNHYCKEYLNDMTFSDWAEKYVQEYEKARDYGEKVGIKVFFGTEVTVEFNKRAHLLVYGISTEEFKNAPLLFEMSQSKLYDFCKNNEYALIQAHPFRGDVGVLNVDELDGIEINCHPSYGSTYSQEIVKIAKENNLAVSCGCDYHADVAYRPRGGIYLPDEIKSEKDLAAFFKTSLEFKTRVSEVGTPEPVDVFVRLKSR